MRKQRTLSQVCQCCGEGYIPKKGGSRFCSKSCRVNNFQKEKRAGMARTHPGFICPKCNAPDLYTPVGNKHRVIRCGTCHAEWELNPKVVFG